MIKIHYQKITNKDALPIFGRLALGTLLDAKDLLFQIMVFLFKMAVISKKFVVLALVTLLDTTDLLFQIMGILLKVVVV